MYQTNLVPGVELCKHFSWVFVTYNFPPLIYSAESSVGFSGREEGAQHAAKLQISVSAKNRAQFTKTCLQGF